jgi:hypothetical protein
VGGEDRLDQRQNRGFVETWEFGVRDGHETEKN